MRRMRDGRIRVSDAEREAAVAELKAHFTAGRLDRQELAERTGAAYAARTGGELAVLTRDLPSARPTARLPRSSALRAHVLAWALASAASFSAWFAIQAGAGPGSDPATDAVWPEVPLAWGAVLVLHALGASRRRR